MNVSGAQASQVALNGLQNVEGKRAQLQVALLKKALEAQKEQAAELQRMAEGKGQAIDIRV